MKMFRIFIVAVFFIISEYAISQDRCNDLLKAGIYDFNNVSNSSVSIKSYIDYTYNLFDSWRSDKSSTNIVDDSFSFSISDKMVNDLRSESISYKLGNTLNQESLIQNIKTINSAAIKAWQNCMAWGGGVKVSHIRVSDVHITIEFQYTINSPGMPLQTKITVNPRNATCRFKENDFTASSEVILKPGRSAVSCDRSDGFDDAHVLINGDYLSSGAQGLDISLSKIPELDFKHRMHTANIRLTAPRQEKQVCVSVDGPGWEFDPDQTSFNIIDNSDHRNAWRLTHSENNLTACAQASTPYGYVIDGNLIAHAYKLCVAGDESLPGCE